MRWNSAIVFAGELAGHANVWFAYRRSGTPDQPSGILQLKLDPSVRRQGSNKQAWTRATAPGEK